MPYTATYSEGAVVMIAPLAELEQFRNSWRFHNPLRPKQLEFAGRSGLVRSIGYYHGGDVLYQIEGVPGIWHECCLRPVTREQKSS